MSKKIYNKNIFTTMRNYIFILLLFNWVVSANAQFYSGGKSEEEIWEEKKNAKNNYDEFLTKHAYVYDEDKGAELAMRKKDALKKAIGFYDAQISLVESWILKGKIKTTKIKYDDSALSNAMLENVILLKMLSIDAYEKDLSEDTKLILSNSVLCNSIKDKRKADKTFLPVMESYKNKMLEEKRSIEQALSLCDSSIIKFDATKNTMLGLLYVEVDKHEWEGGDTRIRHNRYKVLEEINKIPTKWGTIQYANPNYNPAEGEWAWLHSSDWENVRTSYPVEEVYRRYKEKPSYKVKTIKDRLVVFEGDKCVYIEKDEKDNNSELCRQICIIDYKNNKYNIQSSSPSVLDKINEMLIEGKDRYYYMGCEMAYNMYKRAFNQMMQLKRDKSYGGMVLNTMVNVPEPTEAEIKEFEDKLSVLEEDIRKSKLLDSDPDYKIAENYIKQLKADRDGILFSAKRINGLSYVYTTTDEQFRILMTMNSNGKSITEDYKLLDK